MKKHSFIKILLCGAACGTAMILPGVSGGTLAVLMNVYDDLIFAINNLRKNFKDSMLFLLPFGIGAVAAFAVMYFPLKFALEYAPLPTVMFFVGLMLGSLPSLIKDSVKNGWKSVDFLSFFLPLAVVIGICFIPGAAQVDLSESAPVWVYFSLFAVGILASCALVIPGISGSMLLMILGYYQPIFNTFATIFSVPLHSILVLGIFAMGLVVGFFTIAKIMQILIDKFPRATYWAISGFVIGSIPAIFIVFDYSTVPLNWWQFLIGGALLVSGTVATYLFTAYVEKKKQNENVDTDVA